MDSISPTSSFHVVIDTPSREIVSASSSSCSQSSLSSQISLLSQSSFSHISPSSQTSSSQIALLSANAPPDLEFVSCSGGKDKFILYPLTDNVAFYNWWTQTSHANLLKQRGKTQKWGASRRSSAWWIHFAEGATFPQGCPKLRCKYCSRLLEHPYVKNTGTTAMRNHLKSINCSYKTSNNSGQGMKELLMQMMVRILEFLIPTLVGFVANQLNLH